jgi:hypothetical protein
MTEMAGSSPQSRILDRFPSEVIHGTARTRIESELKSLDRLVVRDGSGHFLIDENAFRPALRNLGLSDQEIDDLTSGSRDLFTSASGLPAVRLSELHSLEPKLQLPTDQELDQAGFRIGSDVQHLRAAFVNTSHADAATLDVSAAELLQRIRTALTPRTGGSEITAEVSGSQFLSCLYNELVFIIVWTVIHALALWGVSIGAIVVVGIASAVLWWLVVASFGLGIAWIVFHCLGWI